ncbi:hypothetical protein ANCDUO_24283 [Ancylostoma duodenale]|uniref:Uncharacterized protein n=1 Tax=Ancylostoma duodenale TaxID=51022 RepID=A0A0C2FLE5_9BILA|nr:hypothetical protein ANCDUO_24283 [Ancylostoma duodenale]
MPFYPHYSCAQSGVLLNEAERVLRTFTVPATVDGKEVPNERIVPNSSESFRVSALHRWSSHPVVSEYWLNVLQPLRGDFGGLLFCAPSLAKRLSTQLPDDKCMAVVPISSFVPDFNTTSVLPNIIQTVEKAVLIEPQPENTVLLQGMVEVIKNHLLGRRNAQLQNRCDWCINTKCEEMRNVLVDS